MTNNKLTDERLSVLATDLAACAIGCAGHETQAMARELQEYRKAAGWRVYQVFDGGNWVDYGDRELKELLKAKPASLFRVVYTAPQQAPAVEVVTVVPDEIDIWQAIDDMRDHAESFRWDSATGYAEGWNACRAAMQQPVSNRDELLGWIKCSERMPDIGQGVLAYRPDAPESNDPIIKMALFTGRSSHGFDCYCTPTHWMPLPAVPKQEA